MKKLTTDNLFLTFDKLIDAIKSVGLSTHRHVPQMIIAKHEIEETLKIDCESHHLSLAQVWIPNPIVNYVKQGTTFITRLCVYSHPDAYNDDDDDDGIMNYCNTCDMLDLKIGEGLVGMSLITHEPLFCENLTKLMRTLKKKGGLLGLLCCNTDCSCLVITLRMRTGNVDYAFKFFWTQTRNHSILLEVLLVTLRMCLPSFHFSSICEWNHLLSQKYLCFILSFPAVC